MKDVVLSKRSDNVFRLTMVGDPKISSNEIGIPHFMSRRLTVPEHVNAYNIEKLNMVCNLHLLAYMCYTLPGEGFLVRSKGKLTSIKKTNQLQVGDILYRPLENGDIVLINRPPSVHQHSLIALSVRILPIESVVSINPLCCSPLLGDFDGDCLHGYVPQSIGCRTELKELLSLDHQLFNAQDGKSLLFLTHDSLTATYLLTTKQEFFSKFDMQQLAMLCSFPVPPPAIVKAPEFLTSLWTGEQLFGMLLPPTMDFCDKNCMIRKGEVISYHEDMSYREVMSYRGSSFWLRNNTSGLITILFKHYGKKALDYLYDAEQLLCEYLTRRGLSVSLSDIYLSSDLSSRRKMMDEVSFGLEEAEDACWIKQLIMEPKMDEALRCHNNNEDSLGSMSQYKLASKRCARQTSVSAFKDVYQELLSAVRQFISKDNSMLAMVDAGSKGSLLKLIQQGACLGLQLSPCPLPFRVPRKLNCDLWNMQKSDDAAVSNAVEISCKQSFYAVIGTSFIDGLNPLESLVHAISGRANLFSENAEIPGTLTRKLMFYMRDLYVAYDGTVRNPYGQQIVEFSYNTSQGSIEGRMDAECPGLGGHPIGSWAACTISEAAYGALDNPTNNIENSALMKFKRVLECNKANSSVKQVALLFLSKRLQDWRYGFEYGAIEVKNHLERVSFYELVDTVLIYYNGHDVQGTNLSPWIVHFHLSKDKMTRKSLSLQSVSKELRKCYDSEKKRIDITLPRLHFLSKNCTAVNKHKEHDATFCITVGVETSGSQIELDIVKDGVVPFLLATLVKGFSASEKVEILCDSFPGFGAELFVKVTMSKKSLPGTFWSTLQSACVPIMDLIDWERSYPDDTFNAFSTYGIDAAWQYFVKSLTSITDEIGKNILKENLIITADCLSVTGEFHGLNTRGLKRQRDDMLISSPFSQACLSKPVSFFVNAAKQGSADGLHGTLDAMAWGKEAPVGTGGPFDCIYSGKVPNIYGRQNIYEKLHNLKPELQWGGCKIGMECNESTPAQWKLQHKQSSTFLGTVDTTDRLASDEDYIEKRFLDRSASNNWKVHHRRLENSTNGYLKGNQNFEFLCKPSDCSVSWTYVVDMGTSLREILHKYPNDGYLDEKDKSSLMEALKYHPKSAEKIGSGIREIKVGHSNLHPSSRCFILLRSDGTSEDFSYRKCVVEAATSISPEFGSLVLSLI
ncbi:DNA-directed RNA polymerase IV subunit 1 isoform X1 [Curcuma longa]|uniref:DNA-directed RNA polymerase IV subunit 1 isoform X1 n=1 Tax=Curcuma longa TaxID=136217 RepID=UPI003D9F2C52